MVKNETIVITGAGGFIGTHLYNKFKTFNKVIGFDIHPRNGVLYGDVTQKKCQNFIQRGAIVIHCASIAGVDNVISDPVKCYDTILKGTMNVIEACVNNGAKQFINLSTSETMRNTAMGSMLTLVSDVNLFEARWAYSNAKEGMEYLSMRTAVSYNLPAVSIKPFNIFGPGQITGGAINRFINLAIRDETIELRNYGDQIRSWCYIDDFITALEACINNKNVNYQSLSVGNPQNTLTIKLLADMVIRLAKSNSTIKYIDWKEADIEVRIPSITEARQLLDFSPQVQLEEGIKKTIDYYRKLK
jgi:UDP-glucuronate decarboxylase